MIDLDPLLAHLRGSALQPWAEQLTQRLAGVAHERLHGRFSEWRALLDRLPVLAPGRIHLDQPMVGVGDLEPLDEVARKRLEASLQLLHPWRKGPFHLHGVDIDSEWRSDWKWQRLASAVGSLQGKRVLDVGCGNGYHCWRMAGAGAELVIGIDPTQLFLAQFLAVKHFLGEQWPVYLLPLGIEDLPPDPEAFDCVFSMGVLYHRRSPIDHLLELKSCLRAGGELLLETLVIAGGAGNLLLPEGRYAKMRNVWFIPTVATLLAWLRKCGFVEEKVLDVTPTTVQEQRPTEWMSFNSLPDFLDKEDARQTVEGYPAPVRAVVVAKRP